MLGALLAAPKASGIFLLLEVCSVKSHSTYERIRTLRGEIGPVDFDIVKALRELRDDE